MQHLKISVLRQFKIFPNQIEWSMLEQRPVIKSLVAEKCKPCEIYKRICDKHRQACLVKRCLQMGETWICHFESRRQSTEWKNIDSRLEKKILGATISKEGSSVSLIGNERSHYYWFSWKRCNCKMWFLLPTPLTEFTLLINEPTHVY